MFFRVWTLDPSYFFSSVEHQVSFFSVILQQCFTRVLSPFVRPLLLHTHSLAITYSSSSRFNVCYTCFGPCFHFRGTVSFLPVYRARPVYFSELLQIASDTTLSCLTRNNRARLFHLSLSNRALTASK